jgi:uncharacterized repeat protein (TIGR03843 family)
MPEDQRPPSAADLIAVAERAAVLPPAQRLTALACGAVTVIGRMPYSSNATFLVFCDADGAVVPAVYKPEEGERPLWDFPPGIFRREAAAWELSERLGLGLVPETIARVDLPFGVGSLQRFVPAVFSEHYFTVLEDPTTHRRLRALAVFDVVANNADRKAGHVLLDTAGGIWAIDNGLCFHQAPKLRTVIWDFAGEPLPAELRPALAAVAEDPDLAELLDRPERAALARRASELLDDGHLPFPDERRHHVPWPLI